MEWLSQFESQIPSGAISWLVIAILAVILLLLLLTLYRRVTGGLFIAGGRGRKARLAVMDAAPVDAHRRLVLVRRDDVEHLVMIGGPSDIVVEQSIRIGGPSHKPRSILDESEPAKPQVVAGNDLADHAPAPAERRRVQPAPAAAATVTATTVTPLTRPAKPETPAVRPANGNGETRQASLLGGGAPAAKPAEPAKPAAAEQAPEPAQPEKPAEPVQAAAAEAPKPAAPVRKTIFGTPVVDKPKDAKPAEPQAIAEPVQKEEPKSAAEPQQPAKAAEPAPKPVAAARETAEAPAPAKEPKREDSKPTDELEEEMERLLSELTGTSG